MVVGIIVSILFATMIGGGGFYMYKVIKSTSPTSSSIAPSGKENSTHDFLIYEKIEDNIIDLGNNRYRAIVEVSSVNYFLRTGAEREIIELSFNKFLNSLNSPITFYIQTRIIDNTMFLQSNRQEIEQAIQENPKLAKYGASYYNELVNLGNRIGNNREKRKYIIIPYDDALTLNKLTKEEKEVYARKELMKLVRIIGEGLGTIGLKTTLLSDYDLYELIHSTFHRDSFNDAEHIFKGEYTSLVVEGEDPKMESATKATILDWILYETEKRIESEVGFEEPASVELIDKIEELREKYAGYYLNKKDKTSNFEMMSDILSRKDNENEVPTTTEKNTDDVI